MSHRNGPTYNKTVNPKHEYIYVNIYCVERHYQAATVDRGRQKTHK